MAPCSTTTADGLGESPVKADWFKPSEQLRLNMKIAPTSTPNRLGVVGGDLAGFPNGRRLADDITVQAAEGALLTGHPAAVDSLGDGVNGNVALPNMDSVNKS